MVYARMNEIQRLRTRVDELEKHLLDLLSIVESGDTRDQYYAYLIRKAFLNKPENQGPLLFRLDGLESKEGSNDTATRDVE